VGKDDTGAAVGEEVTICVGEEVGAGLGSPGHKSGSGLGSSSVCQVEQRSDAADTVAPTTIRIASPCV
jgi:hypothetical protein